MLVRIVIAELKQACFFSGRAIAKRLACLMQMHRDASAIKSLIETLDVYDDC